MALLLGSVLGTRAWDRPSLPCFHENSRGVSRAICSQRPSGSAPVCNGGLRDADARVCARAQGIWQHVPAVGEGFPEDFVPFLEMNAPTVVRYPKKAPAKKAKAAGGA